MSDNDQVKPYHARDVSPGQEAADVVADVLKHAQERDEAAQRRSEPKPTPKWMLPVAMNLGLLAVYFLVAQPSWTAVNPIQPPPVSTLVASTRDQIWMHGITRIEAFRAANGRLPASLDEAGSSLLANAGVQYVIRSDSTYVLTTIVGEEEIVYDSATMTAEEFTGPINLQG